MSMLVQEALARWLAEEVRVMIQPPLGLLTHLVAWRSALDEPWAARATEPGVQLHSPTPVTLELLP
jgi:hypothetical protein